MNSDYEKLLLLDAVITGLMVGVGFYVLLNVIIIAVKIFKNEKIYKTLPRLVKFSEERACKGPHSWEYVTLAMRGLEPGKYQVCNKCGKIMGYDDKMLSEEGVAQLKEAAEIRERIEKEQKEYQDRVNALADSYIDRYISNTFDKKEVSLDKLKALVQYAFVAQAQASEKVEAEYAAQEDLDQRYEDWQNNIKGNA